ncbi:MAG: C4-type zinc ribbon domain-containing protein [Candidatus Omnitrophica bacterium]|nr:C4-type zinc ribbon domain-containing protein [Candidatus Omnitrophota bacterium]MDD3987481.1 C4-type zinc ribbon domain-containing protein [Candidatus Omnitrophota bacterium]MDD4982053.1 C4-type zinc ribbon domain-containing protein [Candidatus Omnitrophota bacterium]MDD5665205.1 C4-type zinc ribbon domain-containing protein [Candidatus Omnitrophota bacterium]
MPQANLKAQLGSLIKLQELDTQIYKLRLEKSLKPQEIKVIEDSFEAKKAHLAQLEKSRLDLAKQKKDRELELGSKEEATVKLQGQLYSLKTNKEYQTMLQQIQDSKADVSVIEDKILALLVETDKVGAQVEEEKSRVKEEEKVFLSEKAAVELRVKEIDERLSQLDAQRKQALVDIEPKILSQYERILASRDGLAIVTVQGNSCGGCNMFVPPQVINLIKMYERIITCETCNRMLYINEAD